MALGHCGRDKTFPHRTWSRCEVVASEQQTLGRGFGTNTFMTDTKHGWRAIRADYAVRSSSLRKGCGDSALELEPAMCQYWITRWAGINSDIISNRRSMLYRFTARPPVRPRSAVPRTSLARFPFPKICFPSSFFRRGYIIPSSFKGGKAPGWNCFFKHEGNSAFDKCQFRWQSFGIVASKLRIHSCRELFKARRVQ